MIKQGRNESGKFASKSDEMRQVRSIRLTDAAWDSLGKLADKRSITRADLIEEWMGGEYFILLERLHRLENQLQSLTNNSIQLSESILQSIDKLVNERSITREQLISDLLQSLQFVPAQTEPSATQLELIDIPQIPEGSAQLAPLNQSHLAKRFNYNSSNLAKQRLKGYEKFAAFSASKDPDGIAWRYSEFDKLYYPIINNS